MGIGESQLSCLQETLKLVVRNLIAFVSMVDVLAGIISISTVKDKDMRGLNRDRTMNIQLLANWVQVTSFQGKRIP